MGATAHRLYVVLCYNVLPGLPASLLPPHGTDLISVDVDGFLASPLEGRCFVRDPANALCRDSVAYDSVAYDTCFAADSVTRECVTNECVA